MIKELKYLIYLISIFIFIFFTGKYYFSDSNKKNSYRSANIINNKIENFVKKLPVLKNDTENIIEYIENNSLQNKKKYYFWDLLIDNEK